MRREAAALCRVSGLSDELNIITLDRNFFRLDRCGQQKCLAFFYEREKLRSHTWRRTPFVTFANLLRISRALVQQSYVELLHTIRGLIRISEIKHDLTSKVHLKVFALALVVSSPLE